MLVNRRTALGWGMATLTPLWGEGEPHELSLHQAVETICRTTPLELRQAIHDTGRFLYRGEGVDGPSLLCPEPDLLLDATYDDQKAVDYFQCLEKQLLAARIRARPSTGHIATSSKADAEPWGSPVSVWPLGDEFSYVWPRNRHVLYPGSCDIGTDLAVDSEINLALVKSKEVLFSTNSGKMQSRGLGGCSSSLYLGVPAELDSELLDRLKKVHFGLDLMR